MQDVDFSMSVRAAGLDVVYQPLAVTLYQEDIDTAARLSQCLNSRNRELSLAKWEGVLKARQRQHGKACLPAAQAVHICCGQPPLAT